MKAIFTSLFLFAVILNANAQNAVLKGKVSDKNNLPIASATVSLLKASDSSWVHSEISGDDGSFTMQNIAVGDYLIDATATGFEQSKQAVTIKAGDNNVVLTVAAKSKTLEEVTVTGKKSFIESSLGKTVINVEGSGIATGSNVLDLLRKLPGVNVSGNNTISMAGKQGVLLQINGKETYMSEDQLADYLKSMSANEVAQMELITQPSAKYDASGNAGIINIKLKKMRKAGINGSADLEYSMGFYPAVYGALRMNYHKNKLNLFANGDGLYAIGWGKVTRDRSFFDANGVATGYDNSVQNSKEYFSNDKLQMGMDYDMSPKTTVGISGTGIYHPNHETTQTHATIADYPSGSLVQNYAFTKDHFLGINTIDNAYLKHEFGKDHTLEVNLDFVNYQKHLYEKTDNANEALQGTAPDDLSLQGNLPFNMDVYSAKVDYSRMINKLKLESGLKSSLVAIDNTADYSILANNEWIKDTSRSNRFNYRENVNAAYLNANCELSKKWQMQAGLRAEQVNLQGKQQAGDHEFEKSYVSLFPTAYVSYKANDNNQIELNYGRRIDRPNYKKLDPFIQFINQYSYTVGNPGLKPEFSHNVELKHNYKNQLVTSLSCSYTSDVMNTVVIPDANTKGTYKTDENVGTRKTVSLNANFNKQLYKWFLMAIAGDAYFSEYAGKLLDKEIRSEGGGVYVSVDSQFTFGKWTGEIYYDLMTRSKQDLLVTASTQQYLGFYVSRKLLKDTCTVKLHVRDPFGFNHFSEDSAFDNTVAHVDYRFHTQQLALSFNYNFGQNNNHGKHESQLDEMKRMN